MHKKTKSLFSSMGRPLVYFVSIMMFAPIIDALLTAPEATAQQPGTVAQKDLVLEGGTLIDGTGRAPIANSVIIVEGGRIKAVGTKGQVSVPTNSNVIDLTGRTILPGLIDSHTHTQDWQLPMFMPYGVTTIADENNDTTWIFAQRALVKSGKINGPRIFAAGTAMDGTLAGRVVGQFNTPIAATVEDARTIAQRNVAAGVDIVKVLQDITDDQLSAAIAVANEAGLPALGHTHNIRVAARLGFKFAEHSWTIAYALLDPEDKNPNYSGGSGAPESHLDPKTFPPLVDYLVKQGVYLNPTLVNTWRGATPRGQEFANDAAQIIKDPGLAFLPDDLKKGWTQVLPAPPGYANVKEFLRQYAAAGGKVVVGTDTGFGGHAIPGLYVHYEMQMLVDVGYSPMQAIQAATLWNAQLLKKDKDLGSVEAGKLADFVVIQGNPLADISATKNVRMVIKEGKVINTKYDPKWANPIPEPYSSNQGPVPEVSTLSPTTAGQFGPSVTLQIEGGKFTPNAVVRFDDTDLPTKFVSSTKLTAILDARLLHGVPGSYPVYVVMPGIHGTVSTAAYEVVASAVGAPPQVTPPDNQEDTSKFFSRSLHQINGLTPRMVPQGGKTVTLKIEGLQFAPNSIVRFDNAELPTQFVNSKTLTATLDAHLLQRSPGSYVLYVISPGPHGSVSQPAYLMINIKE